MYLKILGHPVFTSLNFHMPMVVDLSHPVVMLTGENGSGKSTLLHSIYYALREQQVDGYVYRLDKGDVPVEKVFLFDAEQHNPRTQLDLFKDNPEMLEFLQMASHGQVMLSMFRENFPSLPDGTILLLDEPEMALSTLESAPHTQDATGACSSAEVPNRCGHALADPDRQPRHVRYQPRSTRQQERSAGRSGNRRRKHNPVVQKLPRESLGRSSHSTPPTINAK